MNTYATDIPVLPPLASGAAETNVNPIVAGAALQEADIVLARNQYKDRKHLAAASTPLATEDEVVAAKRRKYLVDASNFQGPVPVWAAQLHQNMQQMQQNIENMQQSIENMQQSMQDMQQSIENMQNAQGNLSNLIIIESQRSMNRCRKYNHEYITPLVRPDGLSPIDNGLWFPRNHDVLVAGNGNGEVNPLLVFYGLPVNGRLDQKKETLKKHLGVIL